MKLLGKLLQDMSIDKNFMFDVTLIRGLDYYTGLIYEAEYNDKKIMQSSIASGGRYNKMMGQLSKKKIPCIGMSLGIERLATILLNQKIELNKNSPKVYIATIGKNMSIERIKLCTKLRRLGIYVEMSSKNKPKMGTQFNYVFDNEIKYMIIIGEEEIKTKTFKFKNIIDNKENVATYDEIVTVLLST